MALCCCCPSASSPAPAPGPPPAHHAAPALGPPTVLQPRPGGVAWRRYAVPRDSDISNYNGSLGRYGAPAQKLAVSLEMGSTYLCFIPKLVGRTQNINPYDTFSSFSSLPINKSERPPLMVLSLYVSIYTFCMSFPFINNCTRFNAI